MAIALQNAAGIQAAAAEKLGVSRSKLCRYIAKHHDLQVLIQEITEEYVDLAEGKLMLALKDGKEWAVRYYLENKGQARGFGVRKLAFKDGEGQTVVPAVLVTDGRMSQADWEARFGSAAPAEQAQA